MKTMAMKQRKFLTKKVWIYADIFRWGFITIKWHVFHRKMKCLHHENNNKEMSNYQNSYTICSTYFPDYPPPLLLKIICDFV